MLTKITYPDGEIVELDFDEKIDKNGNKKHAYKVLPSSKHFGTKVGVTTVLGVISKPFLIPWAAKMAVEWIRDNCDYGEIDTYTVTNEDLKNAKKAHSTYKDKRAEQGTDLHDLIEKHIRGDEPVVPEDAQPRYEAFLRWEAKNEPEYLLDLVEKPVYSRQHDYCGKPDIPATIKGEYGIIDLKSGSPDKEFNNYRKSYTGRFRAYPEHFYQCAAYDLAITEETQEPAKWYTILYLDHELDGEPEVGAFTTRSTEYYRKSWLCTLALYVTRKTLSKENAYA